MLHPQALNRLATGSPQFDLTWMSPGLDLTYWIRLLLRPDRRVRIPKDDYLRRLAAQVRSAKPRTNHANLNIRRAWENDRVGTELPIAVYPTSIHPRMATQKSCFTIHRQHHASLSNVFNQNSLVKFEIVDEHADGMYKDLRLLGVSYSTVFPDLEGLAKELEKEYRPK